MQILTRAEVYYFQDFKIAYPNIDYLTAMEFLRQEDHKGYGFFLKDVDTRLIYYYVTAK